MGNNSTGAGPFEEGIGKGSFGRVAGTGSENKNKNIYFFKKKTFIKDKLPLF
jgi:hypothetical protein